MTNLIAFVFIILALIAIQLIVQVYKLKGTLSETIAAEEESGITEEKPELVEKGKNPAYAFGIVIILLCAFFTYFANTMPQVEYHPHEKIEIAADITVEGLVKIGKEIFEGKGSCLLCHTVNGDGLRAPDLAGMGERAGTKIEGYSSEDYLFESLYFPPKYIVEGYAPSMPSANKPPSQLTDGEMIAVVAFLQNMGGDITVTAKTVPDFTKIGTP